MDIEGLGATVEQATPASFAVGLAAGFLFSLKPVALAVIPALAVSTPSGRP